MADEGRAAEATQAGEGKTRTFSQEGVNRMMGDLRKDMREKYSDYDALKEKAEAYDKAEEEKQTDLDKAKARADRFEKLYNDLDKANKTERLRAEIAEEKGVPADLVAGETEDEMRAWADRLAARLKPAAAPKVGKAGSTVAM